MKKKPIEKLLVANRGEIAVRIIRACQELGIATVAVYSEVDRRALHVRAADEAYFIGAAPSKESYLRQERLIEVARHAGAQAVHPGYGFLAENPEFAEKVLQAGLIFVGPPPEAMRLMGDKTAARELMLKAGVPIVPGTPKPLQDEAEAASLAVEIGYPVLLKAAAGGGGKGMRIVHSQDEMASAFRAARSEAESAFGDGRVYLEKYLQAPRHIEFQILADATGHAVHLGERECSIQRRHQKVIEEAPSAVLTEEQRREMGEAAVKAAKACGYQNAGTIEFMLDRDGKFYFLEMNTRLQVEHPVTEMVTGRDLVKDQLHIARGETLADLRLDQLELRFHGHAIECRIYAEDPENNFLPSTGTIKGLAEPGGPGVRVDSGYAAGDEVTPYYDPLLAKLIVWGRTREEAIARTKRALREYRVHGVETSISFCRAVMNHPKFVAGDFNTHFIQQEFAAPWPGDGRAEDGEEIAALAATLFDLRFRAAKTPAAAPTNLDSRPSQWKRLGRSWALRD